MRKTRSSRPPPGIVPLVTSAESPGTLGRVVVPVLAVRLMADFTLAVAVSKSDAAKLVFGRPVLGSTYVGKASAYHIHGKFESPARSGPWMIARETLSM